MRAYDASLTSDFMPFQGTHHGEQEQYLNTEAEMLHLYSVNFDRARVPYLERLPWMPVQTP